MSKKMMSFRLDRVTRQRLAEMITERDQTATDIVSRAIDLLWALTLSDADLVDAMGDLGREPPSPWNPFVRDSPERIWVFHYPPPPPTATFYIARPNRECPRHMTERSDAERYIARFLRRDALYEIGMHGESLPSGHGAGPRSVQP